LVLLETDRVAIAYGFCAIRYQQPHFNFIKTFVLNSILPGVIEFYPFLMLSIIDHKKFPTTSYQGSKRKILYWFYENLKELEFNSVLKYIFIQYL